MIENVIERMVCQNYIEGKKSMDKEESLQDFNGFNIYGDDDDDKQKSRSNSGILW